MGLNTVEIYRKTRITCDDVPEEGESVKQELAVYQFLLAAQNWRTENNLKN